MKQVVLKKNATLELVHTDSTKVLDNECKIKIDTAGICSSDIERSFNNGAYFYPLVIGHEISGKIVELGKNVNDFKLNDHVSVFPLIPCKKCVFCKKKQFMRCQNYNYYGSRCNGGFSQYLNVDHWNLIRIPQNISLENASLIEPVSVCIHALDRINLLNNKKQTNDMKVVIIGGGFLGLVTSDLIKYLNPLCGLTIIDKNKHKLKIAENNNINVIHIKDKKDVKTLNQKYNSFFTHVIEASGTQTGFDTSLRICKSGGKVLWMGNILSDLFLEKSLVSQILRKEIQILGTWNSSYKSNNKCDWARSIELMRNGYNPAKLITQKIKLEQVGETLKKMFEHKKRIRKYNIVKIVVKPNLKN